MARDTPSSGPGNHRLIDISGVGFMVRSSITSRLETLPTGQLDRIKSMRLPLEGKQHISPYSAYEPTLLAEPTYKDSYYSDLCQHLNSNAANDKVRILGDFHAIVGKDSEARKGVLEKHVAGICNNRRILLEICTE